MFCINLTIFIPTFLLQNHHPSTGFPATNQPTSSHHQSPHLPLREVHFALAMLHARHVQAGAEFIGHNVLTSPAQGAGVLAGWEGS